jgi:L-ascorbate metabolism protein UlaG (beta-lactamase superfamily)
MRLTWFGHSTVLVELEGVRVLADPLLRNRIGALRRIAPVPAALLAPLRLDAVLVSHLHHDHCDLPSLRALAAPAAVAPPGAGRWLSGRGVAGVRELAAGETIALSSRVVVTAVRAAHSGRREPLGPVAAAVGHVLHGPSTSVWLAGDTALMPELRELANIPGRGTLDVAAVPVWGWGPTLGPGHLDPEQAAEAVISAGARHAVPVHWGTLYPAGMRRSMRGHLTTPGERFARALAAAADSGSHVQPHLLSVGGSLELP